MRVSGTEVVGTSHAEQITAFDEMTVMQLEGELRHLQDLTKGAILNSWEEAKVLRAEVESLQVEVADEAIKAS